MSGQQNCKIHPTNGAYLPINDKPLSPFFSYLARGHVGDGSVRLYRLQLVEAPVELLHGLDRRPHVALI